MKFIKDKFSSAGLISKSKRFCYAHKNSQFLLGFNKKEVRGQVAIEFIFILLIIIVYIFTVTKPLIESGSGAVNDIEKISRLKNETEKITNNINQTYLLGVGTKKTFVVFIPSNSQINCYENTIGFSANINENGVNPQIGSCQNNICDYNGEVLSGVSISCPQSVLPTGTYNLTLEKLSGQINLTIG